MAMGAKLMDGGREGSEATKASVGKSRSPKSMTMTYYDDMAKRFSGSILPLRSDVSAHWGLWLSPLAHMRGATCVVAAVSSSSGLFVALSAPVSLSQFSPHVVSLYVIVVLVCKAA